MASMQTFAISIICVIFCAQIADVKTSEIWGDLSTKVILGTTKAKFGIPFITRSFEIIYPDVSLIFSE